MSCSMYKSKKQIKNVRNLISGQKIQAGRIYKYKTKKSYGMNKV